jgi:hypothetical protein
MIGAGVERDSLAARWLVLDLEEDFTAGPIGDRGDWWKTAILARGY